MQYEARKFLDEALDAKLIVLHVKSVVSAYDVPNGILIGLATERIEGHLFSRYTIWCNANDEDPADMVVEEISDIVADWREDIESAVSELNGTDPSTTGGSPSTDTSGSTNVFDT